MSAGATSPEWAVVADRLLPLIGEAQKLRTLHGALRETAEGFAAATVAAMEVRCSDEANRESSDAFQAEFSDPLLPELAPGRRSAFVTASLGGQFEPGSLQVAEANFAAVASRDAFKLMVVKVATHVGAMSRDDTLVYGELHRYGVDKPCCGLLTATVVGGRSPSVERAAATLAADDIDRLAMIRDTDARTRMLTAAVSFAVLQARAAAAEAREMDCLTPTVFLVLPVVTLNRSGEDRELLCGVHLLDHCGQEGVDIYRGLGDIPSRLRIQDGDGRLRMGEASAESGT
jgi:hypothetical protein